ncbi:hypothetical protein I79_007852 [Cricetulus griseus]|uniref:Uncharacterized protein n=1 Tax=Cricetulus griseus TaxID=10029 RepID=G3HBL8_CRIGR|nr:hypothetical protein I79_007852 [Cricetulus griseus]
MDSAAITNPAFSIHLGFEDHSWSKPGAQWRPLVLRWCGAHSDMSVPPQPLWDPQKVVPNNQATMLGTEFERQLEQLSRFIPIISPKTCKLWLYTGVTTVLANHTAPHTIALWCLFHW